LQALNAMGRVGYQLEAAQLADQLMTEVTRPRIRLTETLFRSNAGTAGSFESSRRPGGSQVSEVVEGNDVQTRK